MNMCKIAICDDDKEYREKIKTVIETEGILSSNEIRFYEYESGKELLEDADMVCAPSSRQLKKYRFFATQIMLGSIFMLP